MYSVLFSIPPPTQQNLELTEVLQKHSFILSESPPSLYTLEGYIVVSVRSILLGVCRFSCP